MIAGNHKEKMFCIKDFQIFRDSYFHSNGYPRASGYRVEDRHPVFLNKIENSLQKGEVGKVAGSRAKNFHSRWLVKKNRG